jgi:hypothetical protein|tara:strand:- start:1685 stop:2128 length:444 start_codon:yes stop_codon:yes gene_type:complete
MGRITIMKVVKSHLKQLIKEELSQVLKENVESPHTGKSVEEIASWYHQKWDNMRNQFGGGAHAEMVDRMVSDTIEDTINQIAYDPQIRQDYYPHLSEDEVEKLVSLLSHGPSMPSPSAPRSKEAHSPLRGETEEPDYAANFPMRSRE